IRYFMADSQGRWGITQIDGVDWEPFSEQNDIEIVEGRAPEGLDEVVLDQRRIEEDSVKVGDTIELFGKHSYKVTGVFAPPSGARIKMSLAAMQDVLQTENCTYILVKVKDCVDPQTVADRINAELPGNSVTITADIITNATERVPGRKPLLRIL